MSDPKTMIDNAPMNGFQIFVVVMCIALNALDGFDVLAISFASPGIAMEWSINRAELGIVLAAELFGMAVGSILLGRLADRHGRRPTIVFCLLIMTLGMYAASLVGSVGYLLVVRFITGLGIGGMLASTNAMAAEFSNRRYRNLAVIFMASGYPLGAVVGGSLSTLLLQFYDWRAIFVFGSIVTGVFLLLTWLFLPESVQFLAARRPANALEKINRTLSRMGHKAIVQLEAISADAERPTFHKLFSPDFRTPVFLMIVAYFMLIMTFYFILKWIPKIVVDMGYEATAAGGVLVWANIGGATGAFLLGIIASRVPLRQLLIAVLLISFVMVSAFGHGQTGLSELALMAAATGFFTNASVVGFYALMANTFPADIRASGTGVVIGLGRGGAALGPVIAGFLFNADFDLPTVSIVMGTGALVAALALLILKPTTKQNPVISNLQLQ
ncbi:MFS transporter [Microbulbifer pacificus]|uniref:MFS transporter n=1 Tax=Microbulbifer pacificus TaxID=407164 RepID=A0AAU0N3D8_9GAMM|nr:MFS transporter [Microbulbifer pacificus]WOX07023.1 MFS transporter [Microbulbifer pacificus]